MEEEKLEEGDLKEENFFIHQEEVLQEEGDWK